jgi:tRNA1(Val) A37 N6-methylase TrmN6
MNWQVINADVLDWSASYDGPKFHACLCDPPYGLEFMGKEWDEAQHKMSRV